MKHLIFLLFFYPYFAHSQSVDNVKWDYCCAWIQLGGANSATILYIDYGDRAYGDKSQLNKDFGDAKPPEVVRDSTRNPQLMSPAHGFDLLGAQGWELVTSYEAKDFALVNRQYFVFKRKRSK